MSDKSKKPAKPRPKIHFIDEGIVIAAKSGLAVDVDLGVVKFHKHHRDLGIRPGPESSKARICAWAERLLKAGWPDTKKKLAERLSSDLARHHRDEPKMKPKQVGRAITPIWRKFRPDRSRNP